MEAVRIFIPPASLEKISIPDFDFFIGGLATVRQRPFEYFFIRGRSHTGSCLNIQHSLPSFSREGFVDCGSDGTLQNVTYLLRA
jgi:hypothetical protein